jgi:hypothetical protein
MTAGGGQFGEELGMAREAEACGVQRGLGDGGGDQTADRAGEAAWAGLGWPATTELVSGMSSTGRASAKASAASSGRVTV